MTFRERLNNGLLIIDGAMGTEIQKIDPTDAEWDGKQGCSEVLNLTIPEKIQTIHENYLSAGADIVETNTFGANDLVLSEYDLADQTEKINEIAAGLARKAADKFSKDRARFVAGSMGPGTKLASLGQITYDELYSSYSTQCKGLIKGEVDLFMIETCQDILQVKAAINSIRDVSTEMNKDLPIIVSLTIEATGTMLIGTELAAAITAITPLNPDVIGLNCATGPDAMAPYIKELSESFAGHILVMPNAGLPKNIDGKMAYDLPKETFVAKVLEYIKNNGVQIAGGCCGTTPEFINHLYNETRDIVPGKRNIESAPSISSLFSSKLIKQIPAPMYIGERANTNGSKKFRELLLAGNWDEIVEIAKKQQQTGAHSLDLCVAYTGRDEIADMSEAVSRIRTQVDLPLVIDSTTIEAIEAALKLYGGRATINSINLEEGEERAHKICRLAKRYGAALIALTIDETGMAKEVDHKVEVAKRIYDIAVNKNGLKPGDLIFDALTFTLGSGDETMRNAGINTLEGIKRIKEELPGVFTTLGLSNISFGLNSYSRKILNSVYLSEAVKAGLDTAIVNVIHIIPLHKIEENDINITLDLINNKSDKILFDFIKHFENKSGTIQTEEDNEDNIPTEEKIKKRVINGSKSGLEDLLKEQLKETGPLKIINELLIPGMKVVGELFGSGKMQLPFVLQSAEVMRFAVDILEPFMEKKEEESKTTLVLATVRGDVHDIGKNLVDIILTNNGFKVHNLGIKCEVETMLKKAKEIGADAIGMSGLLVKSTIIMKENLEYLRDNKMKIPVMLGGAALTRSYVDDVCDPILDSSVVYCKDAFDGLNVMTMIKENRLDETVIAEKEKRKTKSVKKMPIKTPEKEEIINHNLNIPNPPFWGNKTITEIDMDEVYPYLSEQILFRGRWGYRRGQLNAEEYKDLIDNTVKPEYEKLKEFCKDKKLLNPKVIYGYYPCNSDGDDVIIYSHESEKEIARLNFPRQKSSPHRCISDFFQPLKNGKRDLISFQIVTMGSAADDWSHKLYADNKYKDYLLFHGLSVESAEALAELWHKKIRQELSIANEDGKGINEFITQEYHGSRYSFGYPACPNMEGNDTIFKLLKPEDIGITMTEEGLMVPEQTTSAFIVHHPQAKYFTVS